MQRAMLYLSGSLFALVAVAHVMRLVLNVKIVIQGWSVPLWTSALAIVLTVMLAWLCFRAAAGKH